MKRDRPLAAARAAVAFVLAAVSPGCLAGCLSASPPVPDRSSHTAIASGVAEACDAAARAASVPGTTVRRRSGVWTLEPLPRSVHGCGLEVHGLFSRLRNAPTAPEALRESFASRGWTEVVSYAADGKDGTQFAYRSGDLGCVVLGKWDGGADGEPQIPAADWYSVSVVCMPRLPARE